MALQTRFGGFFIGYTINNSMNGISKMVQTIETWDRNLTEAESESLIKQLIQMVRDGKLLNEVGTIEEVTTSNGEKITTSVIYNFTNVDSANEYLAFIATFSPSSASIVN